MVDGGGDLVWFVDPASYAVAWANRAFRAHLPELDSVAPTRRLRLEDMFPDAIVAARWRSLYERALTDRYVTEERPPFPGGLRLDVTVIAVERRGETVGLAVFGTSAAGR